MRRSRLLTAIGVGLAIVAAGWVAVVFLIPTSTRIWGAAALALSVGLTIVQLTLRRHAYGGTSLGVPSVRAKRPTPRKYVIPFALPPSAMLVGRDQELGEIGQALAWRETAGPRVVVIHGPPGIGKTALAISAAHRASDQFADGTLFASLGGPSADADTIDAITSAALGDFVDSLQGAGDSVPDGLEARRAMFRTLTSTTRGNVLVVLDDAANTDIVRQLLPNGVRCSVIVTSRNALDIAGSVAIKLEPLDPEHATKLLSVIVGDRVMAERGAARSIVERTAGSPLALQLAAAAIASRPHSTLTATVENMMLLSGGAAINEDPFSQTLDLSFALLAEEEREALLLLGLLEVQKFVPWMLAALLNKDERTAWRLCDRLAHSRLVEYVIDDATGVAAFRVLEHVSNYARARLRPSQQKKADALKRLSDLRSARGERDLRAILRERVYSALERGQLSRALNHARGALAQAQENLAEARASLDKRPSGLPPAGMRSPLAERRNATDRLATNQQTTARIADARMVEGLALAALAEVLVELGGVADATEIAERALRTESAPAAPRALRCLGKLQLRLRRLSDAELTLDEALEAAARIDDASEQVRILRELAVVRAKRGQLQEGLDTVTQAFAVDLDAAAALRLRPSLLWARAEVLLDAPEWDDGTGAMDAGVETYLEEAGSALEDAASAAEALKQRLWKAWIGYQRARVFCRLGRHELSRSMASRAIEEFAQMPHRYAVARCRLELGRSYLDQSRPNDALPLLEEARHTLTVCGDRWMAAQAAVQLADAQRQTGRSSDATRELQLAIRGYEDLGDMPSLANAMKLLDQILSTYSPKRSGVWPVAVGFWTPQHSG